MTELQPDQAKSLSVILDRRPSVPKDVVFREFAQETVALNIESGQYYGLNPTAGRMLTVLGTAPTVRSAAQTLVEEFSVEAEVLERDLCRLCLALSERGLLALEAD